MATIYEDMAKFSHDPLGFVYYAYRWGEDELQNYHGPRDWQRDRLGSLGDKLRSGSLLIRDATSSGHGIGKGCLSAWLGQWAMSTCVDTRGVFTANTENQLRTKTWPEMAKWHRLSIHKDWFKCTATAFFSTDREHEKTWRLDAIPWSEEKPEAFAGLHNKGKRIILVYDEASSIPDKIWEVSEGALTDEETEIMWFVFGNPTRNTGRFRGCFGRSRHRWDCRQIDSRDVEGTNKDQMARWVEDYGENSDFVRVRVRGLFPQASSLQFIGNDVVRHAMENEARCLMDDALVMSLDIARGGEDNCVFCFRRGLDARSIPPVIIPGSEVRDSMRLVDKAMELIEEHKPDAFFYDATGVGGPVGDRIRQLGHPVIEVQFGAKSPNRKYANMREYMWAKMKDWLVNMKGSIPNDPKIEEELTQVEYKHNKRDQLVLESKAEMRKRGLSSPDYADALCFVGDTLISTPDGNKPIKDLNIGDNVLTPFGSRRITKLWESKADKLTEVRFSDGNVLKGKPSHRIFTWDRGFIKIDELSLDNVIESDLIIRRILWKVMNLLFIRVNALGFRRQVDIISHGTRTRMRDYFIVGFGKIKWVRFLKEWLFTIRMVIGEIMTFPILRLCHEESIRGYTCETDFRMKNIEKEIKIISKKRKNQLNYGIGVKKEGSGIVSMGKKHGLEEKKRNRFVNFAEKKRNVFLKKEKSFAAIPVCKKNLTEGIGRHLVNVFYAAKNFILINLGIRDIVPEVVRTRHVSPTDVYNLTIESENVYYANGVLVANCMTFAYPVKPKGMYGSKQRKPVFAKHEWDPLEEDRI